MRILGSEVLLLYSQTLLGAPHLGSWTVSEGGAHPTGLDCLQANAFRLQLTEQK